MGPANFLERWAAQTPKLKDASTIFNKLLVRVCFGICLGLHVSDSSCLLLCVRLRFYLASVPYLRRSSGVGPRERSGGVVGADGGLALPCA